MSDEACRRINIKTLRNFGEDNSAKWKENKRMDNNANQFRRNTCPWKGKPSQ